MPSAETVPTDERVRFPELIAFRAPRAMREHLQRMAGAEDRSLGYIVRRMLADALEASGDQ